MTNSTYLQYFPIILNFLFLANNIYHTFAAFKPKTSLFNSKTFYHIMNLKKFINEDFLFKIYFSLVRSYISLDTPLFCIFIGYAFTEDDGGMPFDVSYTFRPELTFTISRFWRKDDKMKK